VVGEKVQIKGILSMGNASYAKFLAHYRVEEAKIKPFLGKPYLKYGQCFAMAGYFFELGSILAAHYRDNLDAFVPAFLGLRGEPGAVGEFCSEAMSNEVPLLRGATTITDYVFAEQMARFDFEGEPGGFFMHYGAMKIPLESAKEMAWQFAEHGVIVGAVESDLARDLFERSNAPSESWERARAAGVDIPRVQDIIPYAEALKGENEAFLEYCRECVPDLHPALRGSQK
jgi:hypothetical protein